MTRPLKDMEKAETRGTINYKHLKPLSRYSNLITSDQKASQLCIPLINFKIERMNYCDRKRKLDDSCLDESFKKPAKRAFQPQALSPDLGCFVDSPPEKQDPTISNKKIKRTVSSELWLEQSEYGSAEFDEILSLSLCGTKAERLPDNVQVEGCKSPTGNNPAVERGDGQIKETREGIKEMHQNVINVEEDNGYFSSHVKDFKKISNSESGCHRQTSSSQQHASFSVTDADAILSGPLLEPVNSTVEPLEGDVDELWNIGLPIFESSVCHSFTVALNASSEQNRPVSDEVQGGMMEPVNESQAPLCGEESTLDTSYETTLPLKVQVKSVVVAPSWHPSSSKPAVAPLSKQTAQHTNPIKSGVFQTPKCIISSKSQRPMILDREVDLERDKQTYLRLVTRHINENPGADVMSELLNLMTNVAEWTPHSGAPRWQHPSDLTRRNYQKRFGNLTPSMSLHEWQAKHNTHKRFANVPKIFQRSQVP